MEKSNDVRFDGKLHEYTYLGKVVPPVTTILTDEGFVNSSFFTEDGRDRGRMVHKAIEVIAKGAHCMRPPDHVMPYINAYKNFQRDCDWEPLIIERPMGNQYYAGTADQIGKFQGIISILDFKTGSFSAATGLQLAAYERLYRELCDKDNVKLVVKRYALQLLPTERYILTEFKERTDRLIWDSAVSIWHWKRNKNIGGRRERTER